MVASIDEAFGSPSPAGDFVRFDVLIARDEFICDVPAPALRDLMRRLMECALSPKYLAEALSVAGSKDPDADISGLAAEGLIEPAEPPDRYRYDDSELDGVGSVPDQIRRIALWRPTVAGRALAKARIGKPITRSKATLLLNELLERVVEVNDDPEELYTVDRVEVFGSYLDEARDTVGDVDARVAYSPRHGKDEHVVLCRETARESGRSFSSLIDELFYASMRFQRRVRGRSNRLDIQFDEMTPRPLPEGARSVEVWRNII